MTKNWAQDAAIAIVVIERQRDFHREYGTHRLLFCPRCRDFAAAIRRTRDRLERELLAKYDDPEVAEHWLTQEEIVNAKKAAERG